MASSDFRIPPAYRSAFRLMAGWGDDEVSAFQRAFGEFPERLGASSLAECLRSELTDLDQHAAIGVVDGLLSLIAQERYWGGPEDLAERVASSSDLELSDDERASFAVRLVRLMGVRPLRIALKAHDMRTEHEHVYTGARLFTDIRPVFGNSASEPPDGAVIVAMLKLAFISDDSGEKSVYVALDGDDLKSLRGVLDRGLEKVETLTKSLSKSKVPYWEYEEGVSGEYASS
jgi:hypothetical protein